jgi:CheY-like chemotaxis protein
MLEGDILSLTAKGRGELQNANTSLTPAQLEILVLLDGKSTLGQTAARVRMVDKQEVLRLSGQMLKDGLVDYTSAASLDFVDFFQPREPMVLTPAELAKARDEAAATALLLQQKGYSVRIARRPDAERQTTPPGRHTVLVIEDEPHLGGVLKHVLTSEGFEARLARNRDEILAELRRPPIPSLVLLDVVLPGVDGFDVLERMREHPALKSVPVVMLTAQATRDAVLKGLAIGADGYITKPFEIDVLLTAVAAVLGLRAPKSEDRGPWQD